MSATTALVVKCVLIGIGGLLASLAQAAYGSDLETGEIILAISSGWALGLGYAGLGAATSLEPGVGKSGDAGSG